MKKHFAVLAAALVAAAPMAHAQATTTTAPRAERGMRGPGHGDMFKSLNLTAAQKAQVKAIHQKYEPQMKAAREAAKPDMQAMRAARQKGDTAGVRAEREKLRAEMGPTQKIRQQEMAEIRAILTPAQQQQLDAMKAQHAQFRGKHAGKRGAARQGAGAL